MLTEDQARAILLSLPQAEEASHHGHPDFRVGGRILATLWPGKATSVLLLPLEEQAALVRRDPQAFTLNGWSKTGATMVHLRHIGATEYRQLAFTAWRKRAPDALLAEAEVAAAPRQRAASPAKHKARAAAKPGARAKAKTKAKASRPRKARRGPGHG